MTLVREKAFSTDKKQDLQQIAGHLSSLVATKREELCSHHERKESLMDCIPEYMDEVEMQDLDLDIDADYKVEFIKKGRGITEFMKEKD